jgi:hypothetical protein
VASIEYIGGTAPKEYGSFKREKVSIEIPIKLNIGASQWFVSLRSVQYHPSISFGLGYLRVDFWDYFGPTTSEFAPRQGSCFWIENK